MNTMRNFVRRLVPAGALFLALAACGDDEAGTGTKVDPLAGEAAVAQQYATNVYANYSDVLDKAKALQAAIDSFLAAPSADGLEAAKAAWKAARTPYGPSEVYRFYNGPIDNEDTGPEGEINSWPLDENFIDYTRDDENAGLVNKTDVALTKEEIRQENTNGGEKNISTGYHAIEFLLWGQDDIDPSLKTTGHRSFEDYTTAKNADRRSTYLKLVTEILVEDLQEVADAWAPNQDNYAKTFLAEAKGGAVTKILTGMGSLANAELSGERMTVAYKNRDQEDEHSCFSDTTNADLRGNFLGIQDVYLGRYGSNAGPGITTLVAAVDPALDEKMKSQLTTASAAFDAMQSVPFDYAISQPDGSPERTNVLNAILAVKEIAKTVEAIGQTLGVEFKVEDPSEEL